MPRYLISYDLNAPGRNYEALFDELARLGAKRLLLSQWGLRNAANAVAIRDHLWSFMDGNDRCWSAVSTWTGPLKTSPPQSMRYDGRCEVPNSAEQHVLPDWELTAA